MKRILTVICLAIYLLVIPSPTFADEIGKDSHIYKGRITKVTKESQSDPNIDAFIANVELSSGDRAGENVVSRYSSLNGKDVINYEVGDRVIVTSSKGLDGEDVFYITDYDRSGSLLLLLSIFIIVVVAVAGRNGWRALFSMVVSFIIITQLTIPLIVSGNNPVLVTLLTTIFLIPSIFYISHGFSKKANLAIVGVFISIVITIALTIVFTDLTYITGLTDDNAIFLQFFSEGSFSLKSIYIAGVIISLSGILDDATISQVSIVQELSSTMKKGSIYELYTRAMNVGRDHISSMVNTLILVYVGASLPILLLLTNSEFPFSQMINLEIITEEIVRTLVGSIGLILAIPITTYIAARYYGTKKSL